MKVGQRVYFYHYSTIKHGWIARFSKCKSLVYLTDGRWLHTESVHPYE